jgi:hypothetical protein
MAMKAKINAEGCLEIERAGKWKKQRCPYRQPTGTGVPCGDWCPLFGEPAQYTIDKVIVLDLCNRNKLYDITFIDDRPRDGK